MVKSGQGACNGAEDLGAARSASDRIKRAAVHLELAEDKMAIVGRFTSAKDGGWIGRIHSLTISSRRRFVSNNNRDNQCPFLLRISNYHWRI
jgi:hypothetical protein